MEAKETPTPRCYESSVPIVPKTLPEVRNLMRISQSPQVGDASSLRRKSRLLRWMDPGLLGLGVPDSRFSAHASISEGSDAVSPTSSSARPLKASVYPPPAHNSLGDLSHSPDSSPHTCGSQAVSSLDLIPEPLAHGAIHPGTQHLHLLSASHIHIQKGSSSSAFKLDTALSAGLVCFYVCSSLHMPPQGAAFLAFLIPTPSLSIPFLLCWPLMSSQGTSPIFLQTLYSSRCQKDVGFGLHQVVIPL